MEDDRRDDTIEFLRKWLVKIDVFFHAIAAILLFTACSVVLYFAALNMLKPTLSSMVNLVNDVLLALIILELLWTVIRFLKRQKFVLGPFLAIGIIAAVRRILMIEAQASFMEQVPVEKLYEIGLSAAVIITLIVAYYLSVKAQKLEQ